MQSASCEMLGWIDHKLELRLLGETSTDSRYPDDTTLMAESEDKLKCPLMRVKEESKKACLKLNIQKLRDWHLVPSLHGKYHLKWAQLPMPPKGTYFWSRTDTDWNWENGKKKKRKKTFHINQNKKKFGVAIVV